MWSPLPFLYRSGARAHVFVPLILVTVLVLPSTRHPWVKSQDLSLPLSSQGLEDVFSESRVKRDLTQYASPITLFGISVETDPEVADAISHGTDGSMTLMENQEVNLVLFGQFNGSTKVRFAMHDFSCSVDSDMEEPPTLDISFDYSEADTEPFFVGRVNGVILPKRIDYPKLYFCLRSDDGIWTPQGNSLATHFYLRTDSIPNWIRILCVVVLLILSGLFSGLSLGLMSLDKNELQILAATGSVLEQKYALKIAPIRQKGNFLLCSLLFSNVLVNSSLALIMDSLMSGVIAVASVTLAIVIFGEILPQSVCSRHGLAIGAHTLILTKFFMLLTSPLSWPISKLLDKILGEEFGTVYNRERLKELLVVTEGHHGLEKEEVQLISGALGMKTKYVSDVMTPLASVFMLSLNSILDYAALSEIEFHSFTRIPIYDKVRPNIVAILNLKQIAQIDGRENIPIKAILEFYPDSKRITYVSHRANLDKIFKNFRTGKKAHMMIVTNADEDRKRTLSATEVTASQEIVKARAEAVGVVSARPETTGNVSAPPHAVGIHYARPEAVGITSSRPEVVGIVSTRPEAVGIVTLEDVLEELLQTRINDEKDIDKLRARGKISVCTFPPNMTKQQKINDLATSPGNRAISIPPPLALACAQSLTRIRAFSRTELSDTILNRLIKFNVRRAKPATTDIFLYQSGVAAPAFIMIVEGNVEVLAGKEKLPFNVKPFTFFGAEFLFRAEPSENPVSGLPQGTFRRDVTGKGFRLSTFKRKTIPLRRRESVLAKHPFKPPIAFPKYAFIPDYSVKVIEETFYIEIDFRIYRAARAATQLERKYKTDPHKAQIVLKANWRSEVEIELTIVEKDLRLKQRGRIRYTEAEDFENEDLDLDLDYRFTTALFLGSSSLQDSRKEIQDFLSSVLK